MNFLKHVAIIMDGNGRWAKKINKSRSYGHFCGYKTLRLIILKALKLKIKTITFFAFSTENWKRPKKEVDFLMKLPILFFNSFLNEFIKKKISLKIIGDISKLPKKTKKKLFFVKNKTKKNKKMKVVIAINYGGRNEIVRAFNNIIKKNKNIKKVNEKIISDYLYTNKLPEVDLLIRTGGEKRLSNFLLWQLAYTELIFLNEQWPDFTPNLFVKCIKKFKTRIRKYGTI